MRIEQQIGSDFDRERLAQLKNAEHARATQLVEQGTLRRIWRIPGRRAVYSLYDVSGPDELHDVLSSLPLFPWMEIEVTALAAHASDPQRAAATAGSAQR